MKQKAQIGQIFIYVISALVIILVLYYGYGAIANIGEKQQELNYVNFQTSLQDMVDYTSSDYKTVRIESFILPSGYTNVCFVDPDIVRAGDVDSVPDIQNYPLIYDSVADRTQANVFVMPEGAPFYIEKMQIDGGFMCVPVVQGKITLRIEGLGDKARVSSA